MHFLLQTIGGKIIHDFTFEMLLAKEYYDWAGKERLLLGFVDIDEIRDVRDSYDTIPVGSVDFVSEYLRVHYPDADPAVLRPLNVPDCLFPYAGRKIVNVLGAKDLAPFEGEEQVFRKSMDVIKDPLNGVCPFAETDLQLLLRTQISSLTSIISEWRVFVFQGRVMYAANYGGESLIFPDAKRIFGMLRAFRDEAPAAWTLDVAVTASNETVVVECHRFFSCGLYGFADHAKIPKMLSQTWHQMKAPKQQRI